MERVKGIEPSSQAWEARILPLNHTRCLLFPYYRRYRRLQDFLVTTIGRLQNLLLAPLHDFLGAATDLLVADSLPGCHAVSRRVRAAERRRRWFAFPIR